MSIFLQNELDVIEEYDEIIYSSKYRNNNLVKIIDSKPLGQFT
ncbi:hypothetical protein [Bacillus sp. AFS002410]|nr:hypothetical protein [Bacillus sp. AFS002410]